MSQPDRAGQRKPPLVDGGVAVVCRQEVCLLRTSDWSAASFRSPGRTADGGSNHHRVEPSATGAVAAGAEHRRAGLLELPRRADISPHAPGTGGRAAVGTLIVTWT